MSIINSLKSVSLLKSYVLRLVSGMARLWETLGVQQ